MAEPLLLLPGLLCNRLLFAPQIEALGDQREIMVADLRHDDSMAGMAERVLADAPEAFALCGLSMGGYLALEIMRRAPRRVTRLALLDTRAAPDNPELAARRRDLIALADRGEFKGVTPRLLPLFLHPDRLSDERLTGTVQAMAEAVGKEAFIRQQRAIMGRDDARAGLGAIRCPTLVLCGRQDVLTPVAMHEEIAAAIPEATLVVLPHCGHLSTLERPELVNAQLRLWLEA